MLPKLEHDERYLWFVFSNNQKANEVFAPEESEGKAKVLIKNYEINYATTEVWNLAELGEVIEFKEDN